MLIGVPRELLDSENRVAATPKTVQQILKLGFDVIVEHDAGFKASFEDQAFIDAGAKIGSSSDNMLGISEDIYTPLFAIARVPGWCAHRVEEVVFANRIIRPAYKYLGVRQKYKPIEER